MPNESFIEREYKRFLLARTSERFSNRTLLEMIEMTGKLIEAAREGIVTQNFFNFSAYEKTFIREKAWREGIYVSPEVFDTNNLFQRQIEGSEWLIHPTSKDELRAIVSRIILAWSEILRHIKSTEFTEQQRKAQIAIEQAIMQQCIKVIGLVISEVRNTSRWDLAIEKELLESFKDSQKFQHAMIKLAKKLVSSEYQDFFPPEFHAIFSLECFHDFLPHMEYVKRKLFYPLLVDSGYVESATDKSLTLAQRGENKRRLKELPSEVTTVLHVLQNDNKDLAMAEMLGNTDGNYHFILSLTDTELKKLLKNEEFWAKLESMPGRIPADPLATDSKTVHVLEYKGLILFLRILKTHHNLATSDRNTQHKIDDFIAILGKMFSQESNLSDINEHVRHSTFSSKSFEDSYESQRAKLIEYFEKKGVVNESIPSGFEWAFEKEKNLSKAKVLSHAIALYINYLNIRIEQNRLTPQEKLIISRLSNNSLFAGIGLKPQLHIAVEGQFRGNASPQASAPCIPIESSALPLEKTIGVSVDSSLPVARKIDSPQLLEATNVRALLSFRYNAGAERLQKTVDEGVENDIRRTVSVGAT